MEKEYELKAYFKSGTVFTTIITEDSKIGLEKYLKSQKKIRRITLGTDDRMETFNMENIDIIRIMEVEDV